MNQTSHESNRDSVVSFSFSIPGKTLILLVVGVGGVLFGGLINYSLLTKPAEASVDGPELLNADVGVYYTHRPSFSEADPLEQIAEIWLTEDLTAFEFVSMTEEVVRNNSFFSELVVCIESNGGTISEYSLMYEGLLEVERTGVPVTVCIDNVAVSGALLVALAAGKRCAAPMAEVGGFAPAYTWPSEDQSSTEEILTFGTVKFPVVEYQYPSEEQRRHLEETLSFQHQWMREQLVGRISDEFADDELELLEDAVDLIMGGAIWPALAVSKKNLGLVHEIRTSSSYLNERRKTCDIWSYEVEAETEDTETSNDQ